MFFHAHAIPFISFTSTMRCRILCCCSIDFKIKTIELDGKRIKLQIWVRPPPRTLTPDMAAGSCTPQLEWSFDLLAAAPIVGSHSMCVLSLGGAL